MAQAHGHHHHHHPADLGDRRVLGAVLVNLALTVAQIVGGILSGSLALIADALHNLSDAVSLVIAFAARRIARRPSDAGMTFGYVRAEVVAALVNYTTLILIGLYLLWEAWARFLDPQPIEGWTVVWIAALALLVDVVTAWLTFALSKESMNIRAAFLHNVADALGSVGVIVAGVLVILYGWWIVDPIVTAMISAYILWHAISEIGGAIRILMLGAPEGVETGEVVDALRAADGVRDLHHVHLWQIDESKLALEAHLVVDPGAGMDRADAVKARVKAMLAERFGIGHATLELERPGDACGEAETIGHDAERDREEDPGRDPAHAH
ncbi:cation diffusion facilitator family transporter [Wenxinia saemankumensis]|uniref:Cobalt-zinc-cadmium efflux system protein n=1 Tax=Wenxinia saemankumensis TaxID=1447782 RepID=A0A1M6A974_9RHOB|nr:cation diffusion facilitator family transporter [Wenxinia saemankumensis]SHI33001.1 cobalt-zinc-cadmium efflux system protein [Wenxinia saemankumensis]